MGGLDLKDLTRRTKLERISIDIHRPYDKLGYTDDLGNPVDL